MKKLVLSALFTTAIASMATGCVIVEDGGNSYNTITASWTLVAGDTNSPVACPAGANTIAMVAEDSFGDRYTDLFDCIDGRGTSAHLPSDNYVVWLQLTDDSGDLLYAQSLAEDNVTVFENGDTQLAFQFSIDRGAFYMDWDVYDGGVQSSCENEGAVDFSLTYTNANGDLFDEDLFPCNAYAGTTAGLEILTPWTMSPAILDVDGLALAVGDTIEDSLSYGNEFRNLGLIILDVAAP